MVVGERRGEVGVVRLERPERRNALTEGMLEGLSAEVGRQVSGGARAVLLCGAGPVFCAGFDMAAVLDEPARLGGLLRGLAGVVRGLRLSPVPVVIAAHGAAIAGGCALLCGGDVVVTEAGARLGYPVVRLGISPAVTGPGLGASAGWGPARERLLDPGLIGGAAAVRAGIAHECAADAAACLARAGAVAQELARKPAGALDATKALLAELDGSMDEGRARLALGVSLGLVGGDEQARLVAAAWSKA
ncbi:MAG: hypothetical protein C0513_00960 [Isosphaera sp.]|nr:hypothetical protein [Isosphaera sp.]